ncbi:TIGR03619 family F420-dependent LLM class oxidoreductase [[Mycobacterium] wendilense]|uniref:TIGR03619 family F420-dependent LLM class oxidoreductase n=1 Tax=[Mycobacterium] wendilense TaxID=3064284 RepID=A0ABN9P516_9MYCO|nr:TIGR03619 family F420-dependent LLM class oxidoreductase [Mycolicibacterium sp. MU0050]CAJ1584441.1 TIGR03619 family F420-dependent LLM class oxidoreductase [Mycolicibacterium sp. MU0050]
MDVGLHALGVGSGAERTVIDAVAAAAERAGFSTLWSGERVVMVDEFASRYPYSDDGVGPVPVDTDWLDPFITLSFAAAATTRIGLATGVLVLPEHNPVAIAKRAASLDKLCAGRLALGVGFGWVREEFDAIGVPFARRAARTAEYVAAMRELWRSDVASFDGEFVQFHDVRVNPKPRNRTLPIVLGGNSESALEQAAQWADGWYGFALADVEEAAAAASALRARLRAAGREPGDLRLCASLRAPMPGDARRLADAGFDEMVLVASPPFDPIAAEAWVGELAGQWIGPRH